MTVSQNFIPVPEKKKLKADINEPVMAELELYLQAAREDYDWLTLDTVVEQLLECALKKDRAFRGWLKQHKQQAQTHQPPVGAGKLPAANPSSALNGQHQTSQYRISQTQGQH